MLLFMRFVKQLYYNLEEKGLLNRMGYGVHGLSLGGASRRIRYPFMIDHLDCISIGEGTEFMPGARLNIYPEDEKHLFKLNIGKNCFFCNRMSVFVECDVNIGDNVLCADDVTIDSGNHGINPEMGIPYMDQELTRSPVSIGNNCWLGEKAFVCAGVTIGEGCVIGAMSVVTKDIPDYSVAVGNPAKVIKQYDFDKHEWVKC